MSGRLVVIQPDGSQTDDRWEKPGTPDYQTLKILVGGFIERVRVRFENRVRDAYVNEEGLIYGLEYNPKATAMLAPPFSPAANTLVGPVVIWVPDAKKVKP